MAETSTRSECLGRLSKKNGYFQAQFLRFRARCGPKKAAIAGAASILTTVYHMLSDGSLDAPARAGLYLVLGQDEETALEQGKSCGEIHNSCYSPPHKLVPIQGD